MQQIFIPCQVRLMESIRLMAVLDNAVDSVDIVVCKGSGSCSFFFSNVQRIVTDLDFLPVYTC